MKCVLILSAPRSGSSCLSGCMSLCGAFLGKNASDVKDRYNEKGYFENERILQFNRNALAANNIDVFGSEMPEQINAPELQEQLMKVLVAQYQGHDFFAIKDPRILFMQDLYIQALEQYGAEVLVLALSRTPKDAAASIAKGPWKAQDPTLAHSRYAKLLEAFDKKPTLKIQFEDLIANPEQVMLGVCEFVGAEYNPQVVDFVDGNLVHQK